MKAAIYARVSTVDQDPENQLRELRRYIDARGWTAVEYVDRGVSGAKDRRPVLDQLLADARRRRASMNVVGARRRCNQLQAGNRMGWCDPP
jgi:DNA invertase Pin-like site-specific DNA recombinase